MEYSIINRALFTLLYTLIHLKLDHFLLFHRKLNHFQHKVTGFSEYGKVILGLAVSDTKSNWFYYLQSNYVADTVIQSLFESNRWCDLGDIMFEKV